MASEEGLLYGLTMHIRYAARTDPGLKRSHNEDSFCIIEDEQLFLVADGMGAHASGEVASKMAVDVIRKFFARSKDDNATWPYKMDGALSYPENRLVVAIKQANKKIHEAATGDVRITGMGTTVVIGQIFEDKFYVAHVGDSRCYRFREGVVEQLTRDHSLLADNKEVRPGVSKVVEKNFPHRNVITRALGMKATVQVDISAADVKDGDIFLLCSDGLSGMVETPTLRDLLKVDVDLDDAAHKLVEAANQAGGTDNITVLLLECRQN